jgi:hypothetical protein
MFQTFKAPMTNGSSATEVNTVYKTNDLSIFKHIGGNRVPNPQHVKRLKTSIIENGMLCNPILVNEKMEVIDGQHRLLASKEAESDVYFIILKNYSLKEVHTLNLNQKNWTKKDFMDGYADMGIVSYIKLREFVNKHEDFNFSECISLCSNVSGVGGSLDFNKYNTKNPELSNAENFTEGTWKGKDFELANEWAEKIKLIKPYYQGYTRSIFVSTMIGLFKNKNFDYSEFMHKLRLQPKALVDCANREQQKLLIEEIYNFKSRNKINLRY